MWSVNMAQTAEMNGCTCFSSSCWVWLVKVFEWACFWVLVLLIWKRFNGLLRNRGFLESVSSTPFASTSVDFVGRGLSYRERRYVLIFTGKAGPLSRETHQHLASTDRGTGLSLKLLKLFVFCSEHVMLICPSEGRMRRLTAQPVKDECDEPTVPL